MITIKVSNPQKKILLRLIKTEIADPKNNNVSLLTKLYDLKSQLGDNSL